MIETLNYISLPLCMLGIISLQAMGLQLILGGAGLLTLGHTAFFTIGGYASAWFASTMAPFIGISNPLIIFAASASFAILITSLFATAVSIPCLRLRGDYLAFATMGFGQIIENGLYNCPTLGGASGFTHIPHLSGLGLILTLVVGVGIFLTRFYKTGVGHAILCSRDDETVARSFGISPERSKFIAFLVGNMIAGLAGALYVHTFQYINPISAGFQKSVEILLVVVIGGMYSVWGTLLGAAVLVLIPEISRLIPQSFFHELGSLLLGEQWALHSTPWISQILIALSQNSMLLFSIIVLLLLEKDPSGTRSLTSLFRKEKNALPSRS